MIQRTLAKFCQDTKKSLMLLGPRQTGKSTFIQAMKPDLTINLAQEATYHQFLRNDSELEERLAAKPYKVIFIDEIQRIPSLTNTIQAIIDAQPKRRFLLTGSSARKLRRGQANLLPGRLVGFNFHPLTCVELGDELCLEQVLETGLLPGIYLETDQLLRREVLKTYATTYLKEEIQAEGLVKNLSGFSKFLQIVAAYSGSYLDIAKLASRSANPRQSCVRFFDILKDSLLLKEIRPFTTDERRKYIQHPKFYFFDGGVLNGLLDNFRASGDRRGLLFETLIVNQLSDCLENDRRSFELMSFRTHAGMEVDLLLRLDEDLFGIEIKSTSEVRKEDLEHLQGLDRHVKVKEKFVFYTGAEERKIDGVWILPWQKGISKILAK